MQIETCAHKPVAKRAGADAHGETTYQRARRADHVLPVCAGSVPIPSMLIGADGIDDELINEHVPNEYVTRLSAHVEYAELICLVS